MNNGFVTVAKTSDVPVGTAKTVEVDGHQFAVCNVEGTFYTVDNICTHDDGPLGESILDGFAIECPRHGAKFDVRDGRVLQMPAAVGIHSYETRVEGDDIQVKIGD